MKHMSQNLAWIINLRNTQREHRTTCTNEHCGVSCYQLFQTAKYLALGVKDYELTETIQILKEMEENK